MPVFLSFATAVTALFFYFRYGYVFEEGTKTGELQKISFDRRFFSTCEGTLLLQTGEGGEKAQFRFSVVKKALAEQLARDKHQHIKLHYREYHGRLPWRGTSRFVVDSIVTDGFVQENPENAAY
ncbi:MAG: hypothetical protein INR69_14995 [Mucilaginibacter polytrichastri]|nr:hypothetical protein [Mucilaginibacter polytrichastri]